MLGEGGMDMPMPESDPVTKMPRKDEAKLPLAQARASPDADATEVHSGRKTLTMSRAQIGNNVQKKLRKQRKPKRKQKQLSRL